MSYPVGPAPTGGYAGRLQTVPLPGTDLSLSRVGPGFWTISRLWWGDDHADARLREALAECPDVLVSTKVGVRR